MSRVTFTKTTTTTSDTTFASITKTEVHVYDPSFEGLEHEIAHTVIIRWELLPEYKMCVHPKVGIETFSNLTVGYFNLGDGITMQAHITIEAQTAVKRYSLDTTSGYLYLDNGDKIEIYRGISKQ